MEEEALASLLVEEEALASYVLCTLQGDPRGLHSGVHHMKQRLHSELQCAPSGCRAHAPQGLQLGLLPEEDLPEEEEEEDLPEEDEVPRRRSLASHKESHQTHE